MPKKNLEKMMKLIGFLEKRDFSVAKHGAQLHPLSVDPISEQVARIMLPDGIPPSG